MLDFAKWSWFDMMNVTFQPKNLSPWDLQNEFYKLSRRFYNFNSCFRIGKLFGREYGWRRYGLSVAAFWGPLAARIASKVAKGTSYYKLRHAEWMFAPAQTESAQTA